MRYVLKYLLSLTSFRRFVFPRWRYNFSASDLVFMCSCLEEIRNISGSVLEIGCEYGETTLFLNHYMTDRNINRHYYCIDTFDGFTEADINYEVEARHKSRNNLSGFRNNSKKWFERTLSDAGYESVRVFQKDVTEFDFLLVSPVSFALLDVDLYKPIEACLPKLYDVLSPGGILIVDDCDPTDQNYDGAYYAYIEFMASNHLPVCIVGSKLGIIRKNSLT